MELYGDSAPARGRVILSLCILVRNAHKQIYIYVYLYTVSDVCHCMCVLFFFRVEISYTCIVTAVTIERAEKGMDIYIYMCM